MDDLLNDFRSTTPPMTTEGESAARGRLLEAARQPSRPWRRPLWGNAAETPGELRRRRRFARLAGGAVAATVTVSTLLIGLDGGIFPDSGRSAAALSIQKVDGVWKVRVNDAYADPGEFKREFAKVGLDVTLVLAPVSPRFERKVFQVGGTGGSGERGAEGKSMFFSMDDCPQGVRECPLSMTFSEASTGSHWVKLGRKARPGEPYEDPQPGPTLQEPVDGLRLIGLTVTEAEAALKARGLGVHFARGHFMPGGAGSMLQTAPDWRPSNVVQRVDNAWMYSSNAVTLLVTEP